MDEVENPSLPAAGESSPTIRPVDHDEGEASKPTHSPVVSANPSPRSVPTRPPLLRDGSAPPPAKPPPAPPSDPEPNPDAVPDPPDSLTLADLKRIRTSFPDVNGSEAVEKRQLGDEDRIYDFEYRDAQSLPVEIEEWFTYSEDEMMRLKECRACYEEKYPVGGWVEAHEGWRKGVMEGLLGEIVGEDSVRGREALMAVVYLCLGAWKETAGKEGEVESMFLEGQFPGSKLGEYQQSAGLQVHWIARNVQLFSECDGLAVAYNKLREKCEESFEMSPIEPQTRNEAQPQRGRETMDLWCCLTLFYLFFEVARTTTGGMHDGSQLKQKLLALEPKPLNYLTETVAKLRWDDYAPVPLTKMLLLAWKAILVTLGGLADVEALKASLPDYDAKTAKPTASAERQPSTQAATKATTGADSDGGPLITASPLDYHLFRQELSSKYPAYTPPPPLFPVEPDNNSMLPPLPHRRPSYASSDVSINQNQQSILHQPIHIATPAPSPPPSPAGPGKAGKKQNYQTNQMFPFLYPPAGKGSGSEVLGGKGTTVLQDAILGYASGGPGGFGGGGEVGSGGGVPESIKEAAELFAKRMRATRGMRQMWDARGAFMEFERGWKGANEEQAEDDDVEDVFQLVEKPDGEAPQGEAMPVNAMEKKLEEGRDFYRASLPHLQSVVIVLLKAVLQNVTDLVTKGNGQNGLQAGIQFNETAAQNPPTALPNGTTQQKPPSPTADNGVEATLAEVDRLRSQEIAAKALTGILILLLKWFKVCHVLMYEYMTQLLLDSNYVPLVLKLWQTQDIGRSIHFWVGDRDREFFGWCAKDAGSSALMPLPAEEPESEDEAAPPPVIKRRREDSSMSAAKSDDFPLSPGQAPDVPTDLTQHPPEVDELGYPTTYLPTSPIKTYNWRALFASVNYLRILQKITRRKTHRALLLVSYKSSNHLKKTLKVPIPLLRYYTLKLFKTQVPFCGRKWRQGNMKIITAVWLSVPMELRDDWLSGGGGGMGGAGVLGDVDGVVEDALPLEQGLRALTFWWILRSFPGAIGDGRLGEGGLGVRGGFFERELERIEGLGGGRAGSLGDELEDREGLEGLGPEGETLQGWTGPIEGY